LCWHIKVGLWLLETDCSLFFSVRSVVAVEGFNEGEEWDLSIAKELPCHLAIPFVLALLRKSPVTLVFPLPASPETKTVFSFP
jgi:hypothetical protein